MEVSRGRFGVPKWVEKEEGNKVEKKWPQEAPGIRATGCVVVIWRAWGLGGNLRKGGNEPMSL